MHQVLRVGRKVSTLYVGLDDGDDDTEGPGASQHGGKCPGHRVGRPGPPWG